jgi:hypothetical protein
MELQIHHTMIHVVFQEHLLPSCLSTGARHLRVGLQGPFPPRMVLEESCQVAGNLAALLTIS